MKNPDDKSKGDIQHEIKIYGVVSDGHCHGCIFDLENDCKRPIQVPTCARDQSNGYNHLIYIMDVREWYKQ